MKKLLALCTLLSATMLLLVGCSGEEETTEDGTVESISIALDESFAPWIEPVATAWTEESGIEVEIIYAPMFDTVDQIPQTQPAGEAPDIFIAPYDRIGTLVEPGYIQPVNSETFVDEYGEKATEVVTYNDAAYMYPLTIESLVVFYNNTMVSEEEIATMNAADLSTVQAFDEQYGIIFKAIDQYFNMALLGMPWFDDKDNPTELMITDPAFVERFQQIADLVADLPTTMIDPENNSAFQLEMFINGEAAVLIDGPWDYATLQESMGDTVSIATIEGMTPFSGLLGFCVTTQEDEAAMQAAQDFALYATTEGAADFYELCGRVPAEMDAQSAIPADDAYAQSQIEGFNNSISMPLSPAGGEVWTPLQNAMIATIQGTPAAEALDAAATEIITNVSNKYDITLTKAE